MTVIRLMVLACGFVVACSASWAQGGAGAGAAPGASASGMGMGMGMGTGTGPGMRGGRGPGARAGADYTPGWSMMTPAERSEHLARMRSMKTLDECKDYVQRHHEEMAARAKQKDGKVLAQPRRDPCARLKP